MLSDVILTLLSTFIGLATGLWFERRSSRSTAEENARLHEQLARLDSELEARTAEIRMAVATGRIREVSEPVRTAPMDPELETLIMHYVRQLSFDVGSAGIAEVRERLVMRHSVDSGAVNKVVDGLVTAKRLERTGQRVRIAS